MLPTTSCVGSIGAKPGFLVPCGLPPVYHSTLLCQTSCQVARSGNGRRLTFSTKSRYPSQTGGLSVPGDWVGR